MLGRRLQLLFYLELREKKKREVKNIQHCFDVIELPGAFLIERSSLVSFFSVVFKNGLESFPGCPGTPA